MGSISTAAELALALGREGRVWVLTPRIGPQALYTIRWLHLWRNYSLVV